MNIDIEKFKRIYEFGGLYVYELKRFDPFRFEVVTVLRTFSESHAKQAAKNWETENVPVEIFSYPVAFNGYFDVGN